MLKRWALNDSSSSYQQFRRTSTYNFATRTKDELRVSHVYWRQWQRDKIVQGAKATQVYFSRKRVPYTLGQLKFSWTGRAWSKTSYCPTGTVMVSRLDYGWLLKQEVLALVSQWLCIPIHNVAVAELASPVVGKKKKERLKWNHCIEIHLLGIALRVLWTLEAIDR